MPDEPGCHSSVVVMNERPVQRDTRVKRQLTIDCGQKGFWYISYCRYASSIELKGEINVLQDCFLFIYLFCPMVGRESGFGEKSRFTDSCSSSPHRHKPQGDGGKEDLK